MLTEDGSGDVGSNRRDIILLLDRIISGQGPLPPLGIFICDVPIR